MRKKSLEIIRNCILSENNSFAEFSLSRNNSLRNYLLPVVFLLLSAIPFFTQAQNPISIENALAGNPSSEWDISGAGDLTIQGFATQISVNKGQRIDFKIKSPSAYTIDIYRLGWYLGQGARKVSTSNPVVFDATLPQTQPADQTDLVTGKVSCSNWNLSAHWNVPAGATSGVYIAKLTKTAGGGSSHIVFIVRDDLGSSPILFKTSDATWQAYNAYGGSSLYLGSTPGYPQGHATKVSYDRPFITRNGGGGGGPAEDWIFNAEYPMIRWMERNGYNVSYTTDVDMDKDPIGITPTGAGGTYNHKIFLSVGHDEYWSAAQRTKIENARNAGVHLAFFSGNEVYWKTRWEDGNRTLVCYKEGTLGENVCGTGCDPAPEWTGLWRDGNPATYPGSDGFKPENALSGQISWGDQTSSIVVPDTYKNLRFWRNTSVATLALGQSRTMPNGTLGYEWDFEQSQYAGNYPSARITLSKTDFNSKTHKLSLYRHTNGALVFGAGTVQWSWGLDDTHDRGNIAPSQDMQQATVNLFADMGVQPFTLQTGLIFASASTDLTKPVSVITFPTNGGNVSQNTTFFINGTSSDAGGGVLAGVEVSTDGGLTWKPASGTSNWTFSWTPTVVGTTTIKVRGFDDSGNLEDAVTAGNTINVTVISSPFICPCNLFTPNLPIAPEPGEFNDSKPLTLGVKFRVTTNGYITGIRFYKTIGNTGTHVGQLWSSAGVLLANATFTSESGTGWQEVSFGNPVPVIIGNTYVAAYKSPTGYYSATENYFNSTFINGPLQTLGDGVDGPNGVYAIGTATSFPQLTFNKSNYWVDVIFNTTIPPDLTPPSVLSVAPVNNSTIVSINSKVSGTFDEALDPSSATTTSLFLKDAGNNLVPATVSYNAGLNAIVLTPISPLAYATQYTATIKGGTGYDRIKDVAGNALATDYTWSFTTVPPPNPPPLNGLGGPVLVVSSTTNNPFSRYTVEILRAEGINSFDAKDIAEVNATNINNYDVIILGEFPLSPTEAGLLTTWVNAGGTLVAFKPDADLNNLLGLNAASGTLAEGYIGINTATGPGVGITSSTLQFHGIANLHTLTGGATSIATLYSNATAATTNPAVTARNVGSNGGQAYAFTYDLARSIVYTRQGNPAWSGQSRDGQAGPIRSNNLFFPDYVDFNKIQIPQADEQQRLLSNIITQGILHRKPLPKFWFLPRKFKAAIVMTGDDHANGGTKGRFDQYLGFGNNTPQDVLDWKAIRSTSYIYTSTDNNITITDAQAAAYETQGFEIAAHITTNCIDWTSEADLNGYFTPQLLEFSSKWPNVPLPTTNRTHCIAWSDWATQARIEYNKGIRLDVNYYYWPSAWILDRPGLFTGSGTPMRFADLDGSLIDVYQAPTQLTDESGMNIAVHTAKLLDNALGSLGYYGVFTANMHTDFNTVGDRGRDGSDAVIAAAQARQVPVISSRQLLKWLDGRNGSNFNNMVWSTTNKTLSFDISVFFGAYKLQAMVPVKAQTGTLSGITFNGSPISYTIETIKGIQYAFFDAANGSYVASYIQDVTPPVISNILAIPNPDGTVTITWTTNEPATSVIDYGLISNNLNQNLSDLNNLVNNHSMILTGLNAGTTYYFRVSSADIENNTSTSPVAPAVLSFVTASAACVADVSDFDFNQGTTGANTKVVIDGNGALILTPFLNEEFSSSTLTGWTAIAWPGGTVPTFVGGVALLENSHIFTTTQTFGPGSSMEFVANFSNGNFQNIGFSGDNLFNSPWVTISRGTLLGTDNSVYARTDGGDIVLLGSSLTNAPHRYKISWNVGNFQIYVDGVLTTTITKNVSTNMIPHLSDATSDGQNLTIDWIRLSPYASPSGSGVFTSRIMDAGSNRNWDKVLISSLVPTNATMTIKVRLGNTPVPDGSWTNYATRNNGDQVGGSSRYIQYQASLSTSNLQNTPVLQDISFSCLAAFPVKLVNFRASAIIRDVKLDWSTASESNNKGFEVQRSLDGRTWTTVGFVPGAGNSNTLMNYTYTDKNLQSGRYLYRLKQIDFDGQYNYSGVININLSDNMGYSLGQNHPNPFNGTTIIPYSISGSSQVRITVYDVQGRTIKVINEGQRRAGQYNVQVNLGELRKGVYYYKMEADNFTSTRKMIVQ